jgi:hypothetical protein
LGAAATLPSFAADTSLLRNTWSAKWIAVPGAPPAEYGVYHFRRAFELAVKPDKFIVHVSGDNRYQLYVNGTRVVWGPARGDLFHWRYESVDIAGLLRAGRNVLAAVVWNFADMAPEARMEYLRTQSLALTDELHEALAETGWKPWATSNHINRDAYAGEMADTFIFLMNMMLVADITPTELLALVKAKQIKNRQRQDDGYDGVTTKCPGCKRAYDDEAVKCYPAGTLIGGYECRIDYCTEAQGKLA